MKSGHSAPLFFRLPLFCLLLFCSCSKSTQPVTPTQTRVSMEIIPFSAAPDSVDSTLGYLQNFARWNTTGFRDTTKADSIAQWFAQTSYQITDMWFPDVDTRCSPPINTENVVTLKLTKSDTTLRPLGYSSTSRVVNACYEYYRHYIFTRTTNGM